MLTTELRFWLITSVIIVSLTHSYGFELPFLQICPIEDEKCHIHYVNKFFELYGKGIPELNITNLDPMHLGDIHIKGSSNENFNLELFMSNAILHNFPALKCLSIKGFSKDFTKPIDVVVKVLSPELILSTHCRLKGKLLLFNIEGETDLKINIKNLTTTMRSSCKPYKKDDGKAYYRVEKLSPRLSIGSLSTEFANSTLFNGEQIFMETFAETINNNWQVLRDDVEPHLNKAFEKVALDAINKILATVPLDKLFKESEKE